MAEFGGCVERSDAVIAQCFMVAICASERPECVCAAEPLWQHATQVFRSHETSQAEATHETETRRTANKLANVALNRIVKYYTFAFA